MKKLILYLLIILVAFTYQVSAKDSNANKIPVVVPIKEAINKGIVKVKVIGAYNTYSIYEVLSIGDGMHYGKCMAIELESTIDSTVKLKLEAGTLLIPKQDSIQTMLVTSDAEFPLFPKRNYWSRFYAMCTQIYFHPPSIEKEFTIGGKADTNLIKLAKYCQQTFNQNMPAQHAVWAYTDKVNFDTLKTYGADSNSIKKTIEILNAASVVTQLNPIAANPEIKPGTDDRNTSEGTITLNKYIVYVGISLMVILSFTTMGLMRRRKTKVVT